MRAFLGSRLVGCIDASARHVERRLVDMVPGATRQVSPSIAVRTCSPRVVCASASPRFLPFRPAAPVGFHSLSLSLSFTFFVLRDAWGAAIVRPDEHGVADGGTLPLW